MKQNGLLKQYRVIVRGGGDLATGVIQKLWRAGFSVLVLETEKPLAIRRTVSLCSAVAQGVYTVEDITARKISLISQCADVWRAGEVPILVDPQADCLAEFKPDVLVDAILAKKNLGTHLGMAPLTIGLGPGFSAPNKVTAVVETMRGHDLGRLILSGSALPNTGIPGELGGKSTERVVHAPCSGLVRHKKSIGDAVEQGEILFWIGDQAVYSPLTGVLRGLIEEGLSITTGLKTADIDPRPAEEVNCFTISDKARCLGGAVLEACLYLIDDLTSR